MKTIAGSIVFLSGIVIVSSCLVADAVLTAAAKNTAWLLPWYLSGGLVSGSGLLVFLLGCIFERTKREINVR